MKTVIPLQLPGDLINYQIFDQEREKEYGTSGDLKWNIFGIGEGRKMRKYSPLVK